MLFNLIEILDHVLLLISGSFELDSRAKLRLEVLRRFFRCLHLGEAIILLNKFLTKFKNLKFKLAALLRNCQVIF